MFVKDAEYQLTMLTLQKGGFKSVVRFHALVEYLQLAGSRITFLKNKNVMIIAHSVALRKYLTRLNNNVYEPSRFRVP